MQNDTFIIDMLGDQALVVAAYESGCGEQVDGADEDAAQPLAHLSSIAHVIDTVREELSSAGFEMRAF